jgi:hypothetical protein
MCAHDVSVTIDFGKIDNLHVELRVRSKMLDIPEGPAAQVVDTDHPVAARE